MHTFTTPYIPPPCYEVLSQVHHLVDGREVEGGVGHHTVVSRGSLVPLEDRTAGKRGGVGWQRLGEGRGGEGRGGDVHMAQLNLFPWRWNDIPR